MSHFLKKFENMTGIDIDGDGKVGTTGQDANPETQHNAKIGGGLLAGALAVGAAALGVYAYQKYAGADVAELEKVCGMEFAYNEEKEVVIDKITPGGPAENAKTAKVGDVVMEVGDHGKDGQDPVRNVHKQPVESWCEIVKNGATGSQVRFVLRTKGQNRNHNAIITLAPK
mmetsp:Transcript_33521/g.82385  ORF Transcript_33521/g.82385 Transcript_33521/m.82385 type:complete len:171 (+) Transcript_33521:81-593(+)|eukprot:CAMPEP_0206227828 /NCGR_PEP_ID=MMETSP0047_2-20121206/8836_1 /ASSEMBLY_ACC=CAM_ASM_000192 /TAXON_ID=195065 /ORGANISM="Chroomonas mesostigmatica_cf, Strain CCMP1168" /LENGTH=170 /DNA_ID=CAMNT_0053651015 /DNA_START=80 /DNA_END=592 /DNA_ORIENTATION=-